MARWRTELERLRACNCARCAQEAEELEKWVFEQEGGQLCWCGEKATHQCENGKGYGASCINRVCAVHAFCNECYEVPESWPNTCVVCSGNLVWSEERGAYLCEDCGYVPPNM